MCFGCSDKWKEEFVVEHKFDHIDLRDFRDDHVWTRITYVFVYCLALKDVISYVTDLLAVILLFRDGTQANAVYSSIPVDVLKWVYLFCTGASVVLLAVEARKARRVVRSEDISFAFTNTLAFRYYAFQDYLYYCFFEQIHDMKSGRDRVALFVFFRLKDWKKLLFAQTPRNAINILILIQLYNESGLDTVQHFGDSDFIRSSAIGLMTLTTAVFLISLLGTLIALLLYVPLVCHIRGNLKEYCCHRIDKRITALIARAEHQMAGLAKLNEMRRRQGAPPVAVSPKGALVPASPTNSSLGRREPPPAGRGAAAVVPPSLRPTLPQVATAHDEELGSTVSGMNGSGTPLRVVDESAADDDAWGSAVGSYMSYTGTAVSAGAYNNNSGGRSGHFYNNLNSSSASQTSSPGTTLDRRWNDRYNGADSRSGGSAVMNGRQERRGVNGMGQAARPPAPYTTAQQQQMYAGRSPLSPKYPRGGAGRPGGL